MNESETFDGKSKDAWLAWIDSATGVHATGPLVGCEQCFAERPASGALGVALGQLLLGTPPLPSERWPTLRAIGLADALDAVERVTAWAQQGKHPGPKWAGQSVPHQIAKMLGHLAAGMKGVTADEDTGEHPYAHVAARCLMMLGLVLRG